MNSRSIGQILFWVGVLTVGFMWFLDLGSAQNIIFVAGLVATVIGSLMMSGQFGNGGKM